MGNPTTLPTMFDVLFISAYDVCAELSKQTSTITLVVINTEPCFWFLLSRVLIRYQLLQFRAVRILHFLSHSSKSFHSCARFSWFMASWGNLFHFIVRQMCGATRLSFVRSVRTSTNRRIRQMSHSCSTICHYNEELHESVQRCFVLLIEKVVEYGTNVLIFRNSQPSMSINVTFRIQNFGSSSTWFSSFPMK